MPITIEEFIPRRSKTLCGFFRIKLPSGMILHDVSLHVSGSRAWVSPSAKVMLDRSEAVARDDAGKIRYLPVVSFETKELAAKFSEQVVEAIRLAFPDALLPENGA